MLTAPAGRSVAQVPIGRGQGVMTGPATVSPLRIDFLLKIRDKTYVEVQGDAVMKKTAVPVNCLLVLALWASCADAEGPKRPKGSSESAHAAVLRLRSKPTKEKICGGEPVFLQLTISNDGQSVQELSMGLADSLRGDFWKLEIGRNGKLREVDMSSGGWQVRKPKPPSRLASGQKVSDMLTIWMCSESVRSGGRRLVFASPGEYRYLLTMHLRAKPDDPPIVLTSAGKIVVTKGHKDLGRVTAFLAKNLYREETVPFRNRKALESLLEGSAGDSPYRAYLQWLRVRSYLLDGADEKGYDVLEGAGSRHEADVLLKLSEKLLATVSREQAPPIVRDALVAKGILMLLKGKKKEALKLLEDIEAGFPRWRSLSKLQTWAR